MACILLKYIMVYVTKKVKKIRKNISFMEDNMTDSKTKTKSKEKIIFEKLTVEEEKEVRGSSIPDGYCYAGPPNIFDC